MITFINIKRKNKMKTLKIKLKIIRNKILEIKLHKKVTVYQNEVQQKASCWAEEKVTISEREMEMEA